MKKSFSAPWGRTLKLLTPALELLLVVVLVLNLKTVPDKILWARIVGIGLPLLMLIIPPFFAILGYEIQGNQLIVKRPGWLTKIDLTGVTSVEANPAAMKGSIRTFGNGGLFCFCGMFSNKLLGRYRAFVTNRQNSVIIRTVAGKAYVVSPGEPDEFVAAVKEIIE